MREARHDPEALVLADAAFHAAIATATGKPALTALLANLAGPTP